MEIERKFLLEDSLILSTLTANNCSVHMSEIKQFYTLINSLSEVRYRKENDKYFLTKKYGSGLNREEFEVLISKNEFKKAKKHRISSIIEKNRYRFEIEGLEYCFDIYQKGIYLYVLEVEFGNEKEAHAFNFPPFLQNIKMQEVTNDKKYKNKFISLFGAPTHEFDAKKCMTIISKNPSLKLEFPSYINSYDAIRLLLFKIFIQIKSAKDSYICSSDDEDLHKLRVALRKTKSLLKMCADAFSEDIVKKLNLKLSNIIKQTNSKRDLDVFLNYLNTQKGASQLISRLNFVGNKQDICIKEFFKKQEIDEFFTDYSVFLNDEHRFYAGNSNSLPIKKFIAKVARMHIIKLEKRLKSLGEERQNSEFHKCRIELKKLRYLLESFGSMYDASEILKLCEVSKGAQELFGLLQDRDAWQDIVSLYEEGENYDEISKFLQALRIEISKNIFEIREKILKKRFKFMHQLRESSKILKIYYF